MQYSPKKAMVTHPVHLSVSDEASLGRGVKVKTSTVKVKTATGKSTLKPAGEERKKTFERAASMAAKDIRIEITERADPEEKASDSHWLLFERSLRKSIVLDTGNHGGKQFGSAFVYKGVKVINCLNEKYYDLIGRTVNDFGEL